MPLALQPSAGQILIVKKKNVFEQFFSAKRVKKLHLKQIKTINKDVIQILLKSTEVKKNS